MRSPAELPCRFLLLHLHLHLLLLLLLRYTPGTIAIGKRGHGAIHISLETFPGRETFQFLSAERDEAGAVKDASSVLHPSPSPALLAQTLRMRATTTRRMKRVTTSALSATGAEGFISYTAVIALGNPPQAHTVIIDTGSSALAVSGRDCFDTRLNAPCARPASYDPGASSLK